MIVIAVVVVLIACLIGCPPTPPAEKLQILNHSMSTTEYGTPVVRGTAKNVSPNNLSYAEVRVKFYDTAGNLLDTSIDNILDLGPGETWNFEVIYFGSGNVKSYEIGVGSTF